MRQYVGTLWLFDLPLPKHSQVICRRTTAGTERASYCPTKQAPQRRRDATPRRRVESKKQSQSHTTSANTQAKRYAAMAGA